MLTTNKAMESSALADWVRSFAMDTLPISSNPTTEKTRQAIANHLPEKLAEVSLEASASNSLEQALGINIIVSTAEKKLVGQLQMIR